MDRHTHIWGRDGIYHWRAFGLHTELSRKCSSTMPSDNRSKKIEQGRRVEQRKRRQKESIVGCVCVGSLESEGFWFGGFLFALVARRKKKEKRKKKKKRVGLELLDPLGWNSSTCPLSFPHCLVLIFVGMCGYLRGISYFSICVCGLVIRFVGIYRAGVSFV